MNNEQNNLPESDQQTETMAAEIKKVSPQVKPDKTFVNSLQSKIINEFRTSVKKRGKEPPMRTFNWKVFFGYATGVVIVILSVYLGVKNPSLIPTLRNRQTDQVFTVSTGALPRFASCQALTETLKENADKVGYGRGGDMALGLAPSASKQAASEGTAGTSADYSQTNIQVAGVDEADIVKTDGKYIYTIAGNNVYVALAYPPSDAKEIAKIEIAKGTPSEIFIDGKNLLVFGSRYEENIYSEGTESGSSSGANGTATRAIAPDIYPYYQNLTFVEIYNLANPEKPELKRTLEFEGTYSSSRKIDNYVYFVLNTYPYRILSEENNTTPPQPAPLYRDLQVGETTATAFQGLAGCADVAYIEPIVTDQYVSVIGLAIDDYDQEITKEVIVGSSENIYASLKNLYIANTTWQAYEVGVLDKIIGREPDERTNIFKFSLDKDKIKYQGKTDVPGTILNQFFMDEYKDYFRIATTKGQVWDETNKSTNNIYVLDKDLKLAGSLEGLAPGEKYYSARFMGDRAYLVTFKKVDPLFTIDLSDPKNPKILGKLKIPGYSDYLHPYDENHIIGIGKEAVAAEEGNFAWYQGMKMAVFDVTDVANPKELHKTLIGDRGTDSPVLQTHKAFLFSKDKNLLVIPVLLAQLTAEQKAASQPGSEYGDYVFQGSYVYDISLDKGFTLKGRVTHYESDDAFKKSGYYFGEGDLNITRNLYIDDSLYSISSKQIKINNLADLAEQGKVNLE